MKSPALTPIFVVLLGLLFAAPSFGDRGVSGTMNGGGTGGDSLRLEQSGRFTQAAEQLLVFLKSQDSKGLMDVDLEALLAALRQPGLQIYTSSKQLYAVENGRRMPVEAVTFADKKKIIYMPRIFAAGNAIRSRLIILHELFRLARINDDGAAFSRRYLPVIAGDFVGGVVVVNVDDSLTFKGDAKDEEVLLKVKTGGEWHAMLAVTVLDDGPLESARAFCRYFGYQLQGTTSSRPFPLGSAKVVYADLRPPVRIRAVPTDDMMAITSITCARRAP